MSLEGVCSLMSRGSRYKTKLVIFPSCARKYTVWCMFLFLFVFYIFICLHLLNCSLVSRLVILLQMSFLRPSRSRATITHGRKKHLVEVVTAVDDVKAYKVYGNLRVERMNWHQLGALMKMATRMKKEEKKWWDIYDSLEPRIPCLISEYNFLPTVQISSSFMCKLSNNVVQIIKLLS